VEETRVYIRQLVTVLFVEETRVYIWQLVTVFNKTGHQVIHYTWHMVESGTKHQ
jgi:hypothetical protein